MNNIKNIVVIGCGASGGTAAQFARKTDRKANIILFERDAYAQYSKCALPYVISGKIPKVEDLIEFSEEWFKKSKIDIFLNTNIEKIDNKSQKVIAKKNNEIFEKNYDSLILATGANPVIPTIENIINNGKLINGAYVVRTINDIKNIKSSLEKGKNVTIIGGGLIGLEMADNLYKIGKNVTVVETLSDILITTIDADMSKQIKIEISDKISIFTNHQAEKIDLKGGIIKGVEIRDNDSGEFKKIKTDLLIVAIGCKPETDLAKNVGCRTSDTGYLVVNEKSETTIKNIYAAGDCTEYRDFITKKHIPIGLGSIAVRQAIAAGINAAGGNYKLPEGVLQTCTSEIFGNEIAAVGSTNLIKEGLIIGKFNGFSLPEYYPGGNKISIKVYIDEKSGKIISAQAVGDKAAQRINIFACAIISGMTVDNLRKLETAYAPPISPILDAVTLACDVAYNKLKRKRRLE